MSKVKEAAIHFEAVKTSMSQSKQGTILRLALHPNEVPPSLHTDWVGSRYMVAMVKLNDEDKPEISEQQRELDLLVASAGALCRNIDFGKFLFDLDIIITCPDNDEEREEVVASGLRHHLGVESRADIRTNSHAREMFKNLREEFMRWKQSKMTN
tara:strand:- start:1555 stop:2019 length:465 start_codon:yes stop_codon:yes gene_type:complete